MKLGKIDVKISVISLAVFGFFTILLLFYVIVAEEWRTLIWAVPTLLMLLVIPLLLNYLSQDQYANLLPIYESEARKVGIKAINLGMKGEPIRIQGVVEEARFKFLNRPQYIIADTSSKISVKMFTSPNEDVNKGDVVEVLGSVIKRYVFAGDAVVNCVHIRKIKKATKE